MNVKQSAIKIFHHFGSDNQKRKLVEEVYEFLEALILYENGIGDIKHVVEEFADMKFILLQFKEDLEITEQEEFDHILFKADRTLKRYDIN